MIHLERPVSVLQLRSLSWLVNKLVDRHGSLHLVRSVSTRREELRLIAQITLEPYTGDPARLVTAVGEPVTLLDAATPWTPPVIEKAAGDPMPLLQEQPPE